METVKTKRPDRIDDDVAEAVAQKLLPDVLAWLEDDDNEVLEQLTGVLQDSSSFDGYVLAKRLEDDCCWVADADLVRILDDADAHAYRTVDEKVKRWVVEQGIKPAHKVGDAVKWKHGWSETKTGVIAGVREEMAEYLIHEDGKSYPHSTPQNPLGWVVAYESVIEPPAKD